MKPWLYLPPELAHRLAPHFLPLWAWFAGGESAQWRPWEWRNLKFQNPMGISGGVDKNAENLQDWWSLGAGFIEVGTVTPKPQKANPGKIIDRDIAREAIWNRLGFPSDGAQDLRRNLEACRPFTTPVFVNIGKNRDTPNEEALSDYQFLIKELKNVSDGFVVNISSPNTKNLRELQQRQAVGHLIAGLRPLCSQPILLKLSPDLSPESLEEIILAAIENGVDGIVLTNTTLQRPSGIQFPSEGGLSGRPLKEISKRALVQTKSIFSKFPHKDLLLVSVGGVMTPEDVTERLALGANLVQVYSALIFSGPHFFIKTCQNLQGKRSWTESLNYSPDSEPYNKGPSA